MAQRDQQQASPPQRDSVASLAKSRKSGSFIARDMAAWHSIAGSAPMAARWKPARAPPAARAADPARRDRRAGDDVGADQARCGARHPPARDHVLAPVPDDPDRARLGDGDERARRAGDQAARHAFPARALRHDRHGAQLRRGDPAAAGRGDDDQLHRADLGGAAVDRAAQGEGRRVALVGGACSASSASW